MLTQILLNSLLCHKDTISAAACDFQQCGILTSVDSDEPVQPPLKVTRSVTMNIFRKKNLSKSFVKKKN